ncbi:MAG: GtrA family protein [Bacilli bacterium]|nr:GtrA family protein [Bacilli bacterium]
MTNKKTSRKWELIRFLICGVAAALTDYIFSQLAVLLIHNALPQIWVTIISTAIGFIFGVIVNYLISTFWVYQNVDKDIKTKSKLFITWFVILSLAAMLLSIGAMLLCNLVITSIWGMKNSIVNISVMELMKENGIKFLTTFIFWAYFFSFCIKTIVGLVFNYFTRKYILYKEPKNS